MMLLRDLKQAVPAPVKHMLKKIIRRGQSSSYRVPAHLGGNHRHTDAAGLASLQKSMEINYHVGWRAKESYSAGNYETDVKAHLTERLAHDRNIVVPWLSTLRPLNRLRVLEVGCGTGSSTVALAEQGAVVVGIDVDDGALQVARDRCKVYGCAADIREMNATQISTEFAPGDFDLIMFFACLEHMTVKERLLALAQAWELLPPGGMLGVTDTPNRLWFQDGHTSLLPFFHWLPDELAFQYSRFSPRENFHDVYREQTPDTMMHFLRRGRGVSFHEFDLAIRPVGSLKVVGSLSAFLAQHGLQHRTATHARYTSLLQEQCPGVPVSFFEEDLDLVIQKQ